MAVIVLVSEPMLRQSVTATLWGLPRVRTPATPMATISPLWTTAAAMPGTSCFWMMGVSGGETSLGGGAAAWTLMQARESTAKTIARTVFIRPAPGWSVVPIIIVQVRHCRITDQRSAAGRAMATFPNLKDRD